MSIDELRRIKHVTQSGKWDRLPQTNFEQTQRPLNDRYTTDLNRKQT